MAELEKKLQTVARRFGGSGLKGSGECAAMVNYDKRTLSDIATGFLDN